MRIHNLISMMWYLPLSFMIATSLLLTGCSDSSTTEAPPMKETSNYEEDAVEEEAPTYSGESFDGNPCIGDCSGHEAGYQWAEENSITDPDNCGGNSNSFIEGCRSYAEEQQ
jgi:hypothetical protein